MQTKRNLKAALAVEPESLLAARLAEQLAHDGGLIYVTRSEARARRLALAARTLAPDAIAVRLPGWDCLPYDRASPSRQVMGKRMAALLNLSAPTGQPRLLIASATAAMQRLPPPAYRDVLVLRRGEVLDLAAAETRLRRMGYLFDDRVDQPGEAAARETILDVHLPEDALPCRVEVAGGHIASIRRYDPFTQRSVVEIEVAVIYPASELVLPEGSDVTHAPGIEHSLGAFHDPLGTIFDLLPGAVVVLEAEVASIRAERTAEIEDAYRLRATVPGEVSRPPTPPRKLHLLGEDWDAAVGSRRATVLDEVAEDVAAGVPDLLQTNDPEQAFVDLLSSRLDAGSRVALSGGTDRGTRSLLRLARERLQLQAKPVAGWRALIAAPPGTFGLLEGRLDAGFATEDAAVIAPTDVFPAHGPRGETEGWRALPFEGGLQLGDAVIHLDRGIGALRGVEPVTIGEAMLDCLRVEYAGGATELVPLDQMDRIWRYGGNADGVTLDRLGGEAWPKRRAEVEAQLAKSAEALTSLVAERARRRAPVLKAPRAALDRIAARFPHLLTDDQRAAIAAVMRDLASGRPMSRLICGDVGFGKTEVALRAAAVATLAGRQVALLAPTTVLVRQHLETFRRRFAGLRAGGEEIRVESLSRLTSPAAAKAVKAGLREGSVQIVIGTQALAGREVHFHDLALIIIDEEQHFGARQKAMLRRLAGDGHVLTMTATPIPRSLQAAMIGLEDLSVITTPPPGRQPTRTVHQPIGDAVLRQALGREHRRGGQSFVVCTRIDDLPDMRARIARLLPELEVIEAHGELPPEEIDTAMVRFAGGQGDVLLSTNIVEAGLDVPRANTMLVWRADRFGLGQLHQLRGRVGRGRVRGSIILLTDPESPPSTLTMKRLKALEELDRVGAGFAISARDLDLRGAGELLGESQAGHLSLIGVELYQHLLERAMRVARGEQVTEEWMPELAIGVSAGFPRDYVSEETLRVELHGRLARILRRGELASLTAFEEEIEDRFGVLPEAVTNLLTLCRLRARCRRLDIARLEVGPAGAAATFRGDPPRVAPPLEIRGGRVLLSGSDPKTDLLEAALSFLRELQRQCREPIPQR